MSVACSRQGCQAPGRTVCNADAPRGAARIYGAVHTSLHTITSDRGLSTCLPARSRSKRLPWNSVGQRRLVGPVAFTETQEAVQAPTPRQVVQVPVEQPLYNKDWAAAFVSQPQEFDYWIDEVEGRVPRDLRGTLFRDGPGNFERGGERYAHMLDGDGYVVRFAFHASGRVHFRSRFVHTRELEKEAAANKVLYRNTFGTQRRGGPLFNAFDLHLKNPANTNVLLWGGKLLALWEAGAPFEMDPHSLATLGQAPSDLGGWLRPGIAPSTTRSPLLDRALRLGAALTAHPHRAPGGRLATWSWRSMLNPMGGGASLQIDIVEVDPDWRHQAETKFTIKDAQFNPHDFCITQQEYVFFQAGMHFNLGPYLLGWKGPAQCVQFDLKPMRIFLVPRTPGQPAQEYSAEPGFMIHHANGYEEGDEVVVISSGWGPDQLARQVARQVRSLREALERNLRAALGLDDAHGWGGILGNWENVMQGDFSSVPVTKLWEHRINRVTGAVTRRALYDRANLDHPCVNPDWYSRPTRYVYFTECDTDSVDRITPPQKFSRLDTATGRVASWAPGPRCFTEELVFVPRPGSAGRREDGGYLLGMVFDAERRRSFLAVLDAAHVERGALAKLWLTHHVPHGLHGCFTPEYYGPDAAPRGR